MIIKLLIIIIQILPIIESSSVKLISAVRRKSLAAGGNTWERFKRTFNCELLEKVILLRGAIFIRKETRESGRRRENERGTRNSTCSRFHCTAKSARRFERICVGKRETAR